MRPKRHAVAIALAQTLPLVSALSLANFQQITSILIPLNCQLAYDSQIPVCGVSDFQKGCSTSCQSELNSVAQFVSSACEDVTVSLSTLLGIVKNGGIIPALCPTVVKTTSTKPAATVAPVTSKTSSVATKKATSSTRATVAASTTSESFSSTTSSQDSSTVTPAAAESTTAVRGEASTTTKKSSTTTKSSSTKKAQATGKSQQDGGSGGGSPFDIQSSGAVRVLDGFTPFAFVMLVCTATLLLR